jgi:hypothetical protein
LSSDIAVARLWRPGAVRAPVVIFELLSLTNWITFNVRSATCAACAGSNPKPIARAVLREAFWGKKSARRVSRTHAETGASSAAVAAWLTGVFHEEVLLYTGSLPLQEILLCKGFSSAGDPPLQEILLCMQEILFCRRPPSAGDPEIVLCRRSSSAGDPPLQETLLCMQEILLCRGPSFSGDPPLQEKILFCMREILLVRGSFSAGDPPLQEILLCRRSSLSGDPPLQEILLCRRSSSPLGKSSRRLVVTGGRGFYRIVVFIL